MGDGGPLSIPDTSLPDTGLPLADAPRPDASPLIGPAALQVAVDGDTVVLESGLAGGSLQGPLVVPPGVRLRGASPDVLVTTSGAGAVIIAQTDAESLHPTVVENLTLRPTRGVGLLVLGNGAFSGRDLIVDVVAGVGIAAEGPRSFTLRDTQVRGTATLGVLKAEYFPVQSVKWPVLGLALSKIGTLGLDNVVVERFIGLGVLLWNCTGSWSGGRLGEQVGVGVFVSGGDLSIDGLLVDRNAVSNSVTPALPTLGMIIAGNATVRSKGLKITQNEGVGLLQDAGRSEHDGLLVADNTQIGVRVQHGGSLVLRKSTVTRNRGAGVFARDGGALSVEDSEVSHTGKLAGGRVAEQLGDGVQVVMPVTAMTLLRVGLKHNQRAACLLDGPDPGMRTHAMVVSKVSMSASEYGLVLQGGMAHWPSWDYWSSGGASAEGSQPSVLTVAQTMALPSLAPVGGTLIGSDKGQISAVGGVTIQIGATGFDPGRGP